MSCGVFRAPRSCPDVGCLRAVRRVVRGRTLRGRPDTGGFFFPLCRVPSADGTVRSGVFSWPLCIGPYLARVPRVDVAMHVPAEHAGERERDVGKDEEAPRAGRELEGL